MKIKLQNFIKSLYFKFGFFPPERILSGAQIKEHYKTANLVLNSWYFYLKIRK